MAAVLERYGKASAVVTTNGFTVDAWGRTKKRVKTVEVPITSTISDEWKRYNMAIETNLIVVVTDDVSPYLFWSVRLH